MTQPTNAATQDQNSVLGEHLPNGPAAAAILSAGIGCFLLSLITVVSDPSPKLRSLLSFSKGAGPLSGVITVAVIVWLLVWLVLDRLWSKRSVPLRNILWIAIGLSILSLLATFPPIGDLF